MEEKTFLESVANIANAGFEPCVLIQRDFENSKLSFYFDLGIRYFTVGEDRTAHALRELYDNNVYITASITKDLIKEDYEMYAEQAPELYDIFILRFGFSRDIGGIKELPQNLKYGIMPNSGCLWGCMDYRYHWFSRTLDRQLQCASERNPDPKFEDSAWIPPCDLWLFDPYVESYKLIDRVSHTDKILADLKEYAQADVTQRPIREPVQQRYNLAHGKQKRAGAPVY